jgi:hypothetical protein
MVFAAHPGLATIASTTRVANHPIDAAFSAEGPRLLLGPFRQNQVVSFNFYDQLHLKIIRSKG